MTKILFVSLFSIFTSMAIAAETETATPQSGSSFSSSSFSRSGPSRIPGTGDGDGPQGGNPSPVSAGFIIIAAGSFIYLAKRIRDDIKSK